MTQVCLPVFLVTDQTIVFPSRLQRGTPTSVTWAYKSLDVFGGTVQTHCPTTQR